MACSMIACGRSNHTTCHTKPSGNTNSSNNEVVTQESAVELMSEALDASVVPEEELTPSGSLTNAILEMTEVVILDEKEVEMIEVTLEVPMETKQNGRRYIVWTEEAQNALAGGLYELFHEYKSQLLE